jgi:two-component system chemotaxis response regulator CheY
MVTSEANETHLSHVEHAGVNALTDKPFEPETVKRLLVRLLDQSE